ncbi:hypothetical protein AB4142_36880, partial [Variovorax sp. 2RAF20]
MSDHVSFLQRCAPHWFGRAVETLDETERRALHHAKSRTIASRDPNESFDDAMTFGERLADKVASFG